jgi:predicted enzyme related to lactoylglutathione lyase
MSKGISELAYVIFDCHDSERLAAFWGEVLGLEVRQRSYPYVDLAASAEDAPILSFQEVTEPKITKNRLHQDIKVEDLGTATTRIQALGGRLIQECLEEPFEWRVMADPEDNEFCLVTS